MPRDRVLGQQHDRLFAKADDSHGAQTTPLDQPVDASYIQSNHRRELARLKEFKSRLHLLDEIALQSFAFELAMPTAAVMVLRVALLEFDFALAIATADAAESRLTAGRTWRPYVEVRAFE